MAVFVEGLMVPFVFPGLTEGPVLVEVMTGVQGAKPQDRLFHSRSSHTVWASSVKLTPPQVSTIS